MLRRDAAALPTAPNALTHAIRYGSLQPMSNCCPPSTRKHRNLLCRIEGDTAAARPGRTRTRHTVGQGALSDKLVASGHEGPDAPSSHD
jgi:hypothetical protein